MFEPLSQRRPAACVSDLRLDAYLAEDLSVEDAKGVLEHLEHCQRCQAQALQFEEARAAYHADSRASALRGQLRARSSSWPRRVAAAASFLAAAACIAWAILPRSTMQELDTRLKGGDRIGFFVKHAGEVRRGADGERVRPGDLLRFTYATQRDAQLAILSYDAAQHASVYVPFTRVAPGSNVALPSSVELDATLGSERLYGLFCREPQPLEALLHLLQKQAGVFSAPAECVLDVMHIVKVLKD